ncbi:hypothetical protein NEOC65_002023 [Neochlamydia sp. AcF65]|nr:hypothetical protein [Neochlamydia sp. AcF65]
MLNTVRHKATGYCKFGKTLLNWEGNILNDFNKRVRGVEGVNKKIKLIKRKAYGFGNSEKFGIKTINSFFIKFFLL